MTKFELAQKLDGRAYTLGGVSISQSESADAMESGLMVFVVEREVDHDAPLRSDVDYATFGVPAGDGRKFLGMVFSKAEVDARRSATGTIA